MKVLKKQGLTLMLIAALVVTLTLGIIFMLPARTAKADDFTPDIMVSTEKELKEAVRDATPGENRKIRISADIALGNVDVDGEKWGLRIWGGRDITLDLNGHKLSRSNGQFVINNMGKGKLTLIDTAGGGVITNDKLQSGYPLIYNYGELITDVDIIVPDKDVNNNPTYGNSPTITSTSQFENAANNTTKPSVTVKGGKLQGPTQGAVINLFDSNLTVEGGVFVPNPTQSSGTSPQRIFSINTLTINAQAGISDLSEAIKNAKANLDSYKDYRGCTVTVTGGDFTAFKPEYGDIEIDPNIYVGYTQIASLPNYFANGKTGETTDKLLVTLAEGGRYGKDLSTYAPEGYWMELHDSSLDGETHSTEPYYVVNKATAANAGASVAVDEGTERYFNSLASSWSHVKTIFSNHTAEKITLKLYKNGELDQFNFSKLSGEFVLDLNGYELKIERKNSMMSGHVYFSSDSAVTMTVKDSSKAQKGVLNLAIPSGGSINTHCFIELASADSKFILESGTIKQTGYFPDDSDHSYSIPKYDQYKSPQAFFHITTAAAAAVDGIVTIKGGGILSEIVYGTEASHTETQASPYFVSWIVSGDVDFTESEGTATDKQNKVVFDLHDYIESGKFFLFSWNPKNLNLAALEDYTVSSYGKDFMISNITEEENFLVNASKTETQRFSSLKDAISAAEANATITVLHENLTVNDAITIGDGITLDFDSNYNFTMTFNQPLTLLGGAAIQHGKIEANGGITVSGDATLQDVTLHGALTVAGGTLSIPSGTYNSKITVSGGSMEITGGSFRGDQVIALEQYFPKFYGAYKLATEKDYVADTLYPVQMAPDSAAREWYYKNNAAVSDSGVTYTISTPAEWNYFALFVISGADNFNGDTVKLGDDLDFGYVPANAVRSRANAAVEKTEFLCAGTYRKCRFDGIFDGCGHTMQNISVQERMVGIFGATGSNARVKNLTVKDSVFTVGSGRLDMYNYDPITKSGFCSGGAIVGEGPLDAHNGDWSGNIVLNNVKVDGGSNEGLSGNVYVGGIVGHTEGSVMIDGLKIQNRTTIVVSHKGGGVVGYLVGTFHLKNGDIEQGKNPDGSDNGLILDSEKAGFPAAALVGHANGKENIIEDCTILESSDSLIGTTYANGHDSSIKIKGNNTELDIYQVVGPCEAHKDRPYYGGSGREEGSRTVVEFSAEMDEEGNLKRTTVKLAAEDDDLVFADSDGEELPPEQQPQKDPQTGSYTFEERAPLVGEEFEVTIGNLKGSMAYAGENNTEVTMTVTSFELYNHGVLINSDSYGELILSVTLELSKCTVGKQAALITSYTFTGDDAKNFNFQLKDNQMFIEVEVTAATLQVSVNSNGEVEYDGFVGGENESVLGGELMLNKVDNGDGTYTVTPSGLESENYNIVYVSSVVPAAAFETENNALWIALAVVGSAVLLLGAVAVVYAVRKRKE